MSSAQGSLRRVVATVVLASLVCGATPTMAAFVASALIRENDPLAGETVSSVINTAVNHVGGYAVGLSTTDGSSTRSRFWGNATGGAGAVLVTEGTHGVYQQTAFETFFGMADSGAIGYSATVNHLVSGSTGLDSVWVDTTSILAEEELIPTLPPYYSRFNSRAGMTGDGNIYWVGGYTSTQGGSTENYVLFYGATLTPVLKGGDSIGGVAEPIDTGSGAIDFDVRFSALGSHYIDQVLLAADVSIDGVLVIDGNAVLAGGGILREGSPVLAAGGLPGEHWDNFDFLGINEAGDWMATGDTDAASTEDEFIVKNGSILYREGQAVADGIYDGEIEGAYMNEDGDIVYIWDITANAVNEEALLLNGQLLLREGDLVDWNGDGVIDAADGGGILSDFTGLSSLTLGDRSPGGTVDVLFTADIAFPQGLVLEGAFRQTVGVADIIPEPATLSLLALGGLALLRRRRRR